MNNSLQGPFGFRFDSFNTTFIVETWKNRVTRWISGAQTGQVIAGYPNGSAGVSSDALNHPCDLLFDSSGGMYVTDGANQRVQWWPPRASSAITVAGRCIIRLESNSESKSV